jgi:transcriptional regulator with XRE-family HTH domain
MKQFSDRLKKVISTESVNAFAEKSGITEGSLRKYLSGSSLPGLDKLVAISDTVQVNIQWLATGEGPMWKGETVRIELLAILIELHDDLKKELGVILTPEEKADSISTIYELFSDTDPTLEKNKEILRKAIKAVWEFYKTLDRVLNSNKGRERARKLFKKIFMKTLDENESEFEVDELIGSRILEKHLKKGTIKKVFKTQE